MKLAARGILLLLLVDLDVPLLESYLKIEREDQAEHNVGSIAVTLFLLPKPTV